MSFVNRKRKIDADGNEYENLKRRRLQLDKPLSVKVLNAILTAHVRLLILLGGEIYDFDLYL